jgi:hypothetical protein
MTMVRQSGRRRALRAARLTVTATAVAGALTVVTGVAAQVIGVGSLVVVGTNGEPVYGQALAVSNGGSASAGQTQVFPCPGPINTRATLCGVFVSGAAASTTGTASAGNNAAVSGAGCAYAWVAVSVTGCAGNGLGTVAVGVLGPAANNIAVSGTNNAQGCSVAVSGTTASQTGSCANATVVGVSNYNDQVYGQQVPAFGAGTLQAAGTTSFSPAPMVGPCATITWVIGGDAAAGVLRFGAASAGISATSLSFSGCENGTSAGGVVSGSFSTVVNAGAPVSCTVGGGYSRTVTALTGNVTGSCSVAGQSSPFTGTLVGTFAPVPNANGTFSFAVVHLSLALTFNA